MSGGGAGGRKEAETVQEAQRKMLQRLNEFTDSMVYAAQRSCGGKGAAAAEPVPQASRKLVRSLKEIVDRPEAEIYAALLDCDMDPDEAVRRLLSQDTLHQEVKMKPDSSKKKEVKGTKNVTTRGVPDPGGRNSSVYHQSLVADAPSVPPQTSSVFQHGWSGTPGQLSMADVMEMGRPQAQGKPSTKTVVTADTEVDSVKQVGMSSSMAVTSAMDAPMSSSLGAMGPLLRKLDSLLPPDYRLPKLLKHRIQLLKADLEEISVALLEQSMVDSPNEMAKYWMNEVRELCYDIEDFIDNMMFTHADAKMRSAPSYKVGRVKITSLPKTLKPCTRAAKVAELRTLVREASERHDRYLDGCTSNSRRVFTGHGQNPALYAEAANNLVGVDDSKAKLIKWLTDEEEKQLKVVAITGHAGVGKTTLAKQVYHELGEQFECRAFVRASRKPDMRRLLGGILSQVQRHQRPSNFCTVQNLIDNLTKHLKDKRYFIVIDDLWETTSWDIVTSAFPEGNNHSRIMTTTEIEGIAMECCDYQSNSNILKMKPLGGEDSGKLLVNLVFGPEHLCPEQFRGASEIIITKCAGLPLAITFVAGLIITQPNNAELWQDVQERICSTLTTDYTLEETLQEILKLSYDSLPHYLKTCLMYLSLYWEGYTLWKTDLVEQWIAEGFIHSTEGINTREVADSYFEELVNKGMILPMDINYNGEVFSCTLHHIVLDLIALESTEERFITALDYSQTIGEQYSKDRRLSLHFSNTRYATKPTGLALSKVRSICFFGILECVPAIVEFKHLRILILEFWGDLRRSTTFNLTRICRLFQLRYLKITGDASVEVELPIKMRMLRYLETLIIDAAVSAVPLDIVNLPGLLHLSLGDKVDLPDKIGRLRSVRTLHYFDLGRNSEDNVLSLGDLMNLQDLHLTYCTDDEHLKRNLIALASSLGELVNLKSVILAPVASRPAIYHDVWSSMSSLPVFLQRLELLPPICIFSRLPECIAKLQKLCILKVIVSELLMKDMDMLIGLPALTILSLYVREPTSESIIFKRGAFLGLKYFQYTCGVLSLAFQEGAFPSVQRLELSFNAHKGEQYEHLLSGIEYLLNLKEISGTIGAALGAEEPDRRAAESAFNNAIRNHPRFPSYNHVKRADCVEEEYGPLEKKHFIRKKEASTEKPGIREQESVGDIERKTHFSYGQPEIHVDSDSHVISRRHHSMELASVVQKNVLEQMLSNESAEPKALPLSLLKEITCYFSDEKIIGSGGFSTVYKGILDNGTVAVKKLFQRLDMDDKYFVMEVRSLMMLKHKNIVRLLGYCIDTQGEMVKYNGKLVLAEVQERLLCFEYLPNGSLFEQITDASCGLEWRKRYQIISAICEGLYYLHQKNIVHSDLKPGNVLLDDNMMPKIAGFELSRCFNEKQNRDITSNLVGTIGYLAPEQLYNRDNEITFKVDIYSLGITIMEIVTGRKGYFDVENALDSWRKRVEKSLAETQLVQVRVCIEIAIECTDFNPAKRPDTKDIITRLGATQSADEATETVDGSSSSVAEVEAKTPIDLQQSTHQIPTERCSEISPCTSDELIRLDHPELRFTISQNKTALSSVNMVNITDYYVGFRLFNGDTNALYYEPTPELGVLAPRSAQRVLVSRPIDQKEPEEDMQYNDKFFMWNAIVSEGLRASDLDSDICKDKERSNELPIILNKVTSSTSAELIKLEPPEVCFPFLPSKRLLSSVKIVNITDYHIGFNTAVEETNVASYITEPKCGVLRPWSTQELVVSRVSKDETPELVDMQCVDKYFMWTGFVTEDVNASDLITWMPITERKEFPIVFAMASSNELIQFDPPELCLPLLLNQRVLSSAKIVNITDQYIGFRICTMKSNSARYYANPSEGILAPLSTQLLLVTRIAEEKELEGTQCTDKFLVWNVIVTEDFKASDVIDNMSEIKCTELPIVLTKTSSSTSDELIQLYPPELHLPFLPNKKVLSSVKIVNLTDYNVGFNTYSRPTNAAWYHTEPPRGILPPRSARKLMITREAKEDALEDKHFNDKYFVWKSIVSEGVKDSDLSDYMADQEGLELPIILDKIGSSISSELIQFDPAEICIPLLLNKTMLFSVNVINITDFYVAFNAYWFQRIAPRDRRSKKEGILSPRSSKKITLGWLTAENELEDMEANGGYFVWNRVVTDRVESGDIISYMDEEESKKVPLIPKKASPCTADGLIRFDPPQLSLPFIPNKPLVLSVNLVNNMDYAVAFRGYHQKSNVGWYYMEPQTGVMPPRSTQRLVVKMVPRIEEQHDMHCADKFFLWCNLVSEGVQAGDFDTFHEGIKELPIVYNKTSLCASDELIQFDPPQLPFPFVSNKRVPMLHLSKGMFKITNVTDHIVGFSIWSHADNYARYKIEPGEGILPPQSTQTIEVRRILNGNQTEDVQCKDKIFVWNGIVTEAVEVSDVRGYWKNNDKELPVVLTMPGESSSR